MNKKFLSAILFGALMVTSTGTFVSCKDYDDDIDQINKELTDIKSQIAALQAEVNGGNWVTSLSSVEGGFTVTFKDGKSYTITNGKDGAQGEAGKDGKGTTVEVKDGYWYLDGEKTDFLAVIESQLGGKIKTPTVNADGYWVFYDKDGKEVISEHKANGATYAVEANGKYTLYVPDEKGEMQKIELPTAASMISSLLVDKTKLELNYFVFSPTDAAKKAWKGTRTLTTDKYIIAGNVSENDMQIRIDPVSVDATTINFDLVDSNNEIPNKVTFTPSENKGLITRAAYGNGRYILTFDQITLKNDKALSDYQKQFTATVNGTSENRVYALNAGNSFRSAYQMTIEVKLATDNAYTELNVNEDVVTLSSNDRLVTVNAGEVNYVWVDKPANLYDMWLEVTDAYKEAFGLVIDQTDGTFKVTKNPDEITAANFPMTIHTMNNEGVVADTKITVQLSNAITSPTEYATVSHLVKADADKNYFKADLSIMKTALASSLNTWKIKVNPALTGIEVYKDADLKDKVTTPGIDTKVVSEIADKGFANETKAATSTENSNFVKFYVDNTKASSALKINTVYYAKINFLNKDNSGEVINSIIVPFQLTVPALTELFVPQTGVFVSGVANAYMDASATTAAVAPSYTIKSAFENFKANVGTSTFDVALDDDTNISGTKKSQNLADFNVTSITSANIEDLTITLKTAGVSINNGNKTPEGYKKELIASFKNVKYLGLYSYTDQAYTFKIKVMSPILEGKVTAVGGEVVVPATDLDGYQVNDSHIKGYTYNEIGYSIFKDKVATGSVFNAWNRKEIKSVAFDEAKGSENIFEVAASQTEGTPKDGDKAAVLSYVKVTPKNLAETASGNMVVTVEDAWGYILTQTIKVTVKVGE